ncbi:pentapeptide repeat-containing protein [Actinomadura sp. WMMB 499]|uniref:pentapeptide repeat-containing protein n=1 Tax=Actinomadura sp. WMMB 499 TaxID=1219491 RepID=UPI0012450196|nr:pentapeptide repeat-containing protein [Actinomadura sp. WMMB 499]QFG23400.1 pentapeptide repeat-containing protein [Actinomadura sp. WMMB 499]
MPSRTTTLKEPKAPRIPASLAPADPLEHELRDDGTYIALEWGPFDLVGHDVESVDFERCRFTDTRLSAGTLRRAGFADVAFTGCDLANLRLFDSRAFSARVRTSRLTGMSWTDCGFRDVLFDECRADLSDYRFSRFKDVVFRDCNLQEANFQGADLSGVRFENCRLAGAQFSDATLTGARFTGCDLWDVAGVASLGGAILAPSDARSALPSLAAALGITIAD